jgi:hypothetical protein
VVDPLLKERAQLLVEKKEEPKAANNAAEKPGGTNEMQFAAPPAGN